MNMEQRQGNFSVNKVTKEYTSDLSIISKSSNDNRQMASRCVLEDFPHSQHRPGIIEYGLKIQMIRSIPKPRWNFRKANWFAKELDHIVQWIPANPNSYERFMGAVKLIAKKYIPSGFRK